MENYNINKIMNRLYHSEMNNIYFHTGLMWFTVLTWWNFLLILRYFSISFLVSTFNNLPSIIWASNAEQYWLRPSSLTHARETQMWSTEQIEGYLLKKYIYRQSTQDTYKIKRFCKQVSYKYRVMSIWVQLKILYHV